RCCSAAGTWRASRSDRTTAWSPTRVSSPTAACWRGRRERAKRTVNALDLVVVVLAFGAGVGGWRLGFVARALGWGGVAVGVALGARFVPRVVTAFGGTRPENRASVAVGFLLITAALGQTVGLALGAL